MNYVAKVKVIAANANRKKVSCAICSFFVFFFFHNIFAVVIFKGLKYIAPLMHCCIEIGQSKHCMDNFSFNHFVNECSVLLLFLLCTTAWRNICYLIYQSTLHFTALMSHFFSFHLLLLLSIQLELLMCMVALMPLIRGVSVCIMYVTHINGREEN